MVKLSYEQPSLKKYGTMQEFTLSSAGSGGDAAGRGRDPNNLTNFGDPILPGVGGGTLNDNNKGDDFSRD